MLGRRKAQRDIFEGDVQYLGYVGEKTFYGFLARHRDGLFNDEDFAELYCHDNGRPSVPPSVLAVGLLLQSHDRVSDQEAAERAAYDLRWKVALGCEERERPFAKSTLQLFRAQLLVNPQQRLAFERSLELGRKLGYVRESKPAKLALDTSNILGRGAVKDTYNLISDGIKQVLVGLARSRGEKVEELAGETGLGRHLGSSIKGESVVDWEAAESVAEFLGGLVGDARRVLEMAGDELAGLERESAGWRRLKAGCQILEAILLQDVEERKAALVATAEWGQEASDGRLELRDNPSGERICSVHDPEIRHGRKSASKRFDGHKLSLAVEVESQLVVAVEVLEGSAADDEGALELVAAAGTALGCEVAAVLADCAYGSGENRQRFMEAGVTLYAKVPKEGERGILPKSAFRINLEQMTCTCPGGQVSGEVRPLGWRRGKNASRVAQRAFVFAGRVCADCPLRARCMKTTDLRQGRRVTLHPQEHLLQEARAWRHSDAFQEFRKERQVVEHRIARLMQLGVRQARYFGRHKTLFQVLMAAAVANLTLIANRLPDGDGRGTHDWGSHLAHKAAPALRRALHALLQFRFPPSKLGVDVRWRRARLRLQPSLAL